MNGRPDDSELRTAASPPRVLADSFDARHVSLDDDATLWPEERTAAVRKVRSSARQDLRKLLAMSPRRREARIEDAESRRSFRSRALAELLLRESRGRRRDDPEEAEGLARLAGLVVHWIPSPHSSPFTGEGWRQEIWLRVRAGRADCLRRMGRLELAEKLCDDLRSLLANAAGAHPALLAEVLEVEAALAARRGGSAEAVGLLTRAVEQARRAGSRTGMARCLGAAGELLRGRGETAEAVAAYHWAARVLEPAALAAERRTLLSGLGHALCDAGDGAAAAAVLAELEEGGGEGDGADGPSTAGRRALAGRVAAARGEGERAVELLAAARRELAGAGRTVDAVLTTLDLAAALHATGGKAELGRLAEELAGLDGPPEVAAVLPDDRSRLRSGELSRRRAGELTRALLVERQLAR